MKTITFYQFETNPRFPLFLLDVRWKSGVTFVRRCFRDDEETFLTTTHILLPYYGEFTKIIFKLLPNVHLN